MQEQEKNCYDTEQLNCPETVGEKCREKKKLNTSKEVSCPCHNRNIFNSIRGEENTER